MKIIRQNTPDFIVDLGEANTGDYALEDFLILFDETCNSITLPSQDKIKGNPNFYFQCITKSAFNWTLKLSAPDYTPVPVQVNPSGKVSQFNISQNQAMQDQMLYYIKPLAGGCWIAAGGT